MRIDTQAVNKQLMKVVRDIKQGRWDVKAPLPPSLISLPNPIGKIRRYLGLSQSAFAALLGISVRTLQEWEQGRCKPSGPARALLRVAYTHAEVFY